MLINRDQMEYLQVCLYDYLHDRDLIDEYIYKIKKHYKVPSLWQLTSDQAEQVITRLESLLN